MFYARWDECERESLQKGNWCTINIDLFLLGAILKVVTSNIYIAYAIKPNLLDAPEVFLSSTNQRVRVKGGGRGGSMMMRSDVTEPPAKVVGTGASS